MIRISKTILDTTQVVGVMIVVLGGWSAKAVAQELCPIGATPHRLEDGAYRCCVRLSCPKGSYGQACLEGQPETTKCIRCASDHYQPVRSLSDQGSNCWEKEICRISEGYMIEYNGSTTEDRICTCDRSRGYHRASYDEEDKPQFCIYKVCPKGSELTFEGKCHHCKPGFFKPEHGPELCKPWKDCQTLGMERIRPGSHLLDSECHPVSTTETNTTEGATNVNINEPRSLVAIIVPCVVIGVVLMVITIVCVKRRQPPSKLTHSNVENQAVQNSSFTDREDSMSTGTELQGLSNPFRVTENNGYRPEFVSQTSLQASQSCDCLNVSRENETMTDEHPNENGVVRATDPAERPVIQQFFIKTLNY